MNITKKLGLLVVLVAMAVAVIAATSTNLFNNV